MLGPAKVQGYKCLMMKFILLHCQANPTPSDHTQVLLKTNFYTGIADQIMVADLHKNRSLSFEGWDHDLFTQVGERTTLPQADLQSGPDFGLSRLPCPGQLQNQGAPFSVHFLLVLL